MVMGFLQDDRPAKLKNGENWHFGERDVQYRYACQRVLGYLENYLDLTCT
jgi:hypothetical protein